MSSLIRLNQVSKTFGKGDLLVHAVKEVSLEIEQGEFSALVGPSGSGKSTLLNLISGLDQPSGGEVYLNDRLISEMSGGELSDFRRDHIGFVFQSYNLIPVLTVLENIEYIMLLQGVNKEERRRRTLEILGELGLEGMEHRRPAELSGGQQQRVAIARAMVSKPKLILADEPTANLDSKTGSELLDKMRQLNLDRGMTFLFSTHDQEIMRRARRLMTLKDGQVVSDESRQD